MGRYAPLGAVVCAAFLAAQHAAAAEPVRPLRTLVYDVSYTAESQSTEQTSGFRRGGGAIAVGSAAVERSSGVDDAGTLRVDVVAATRDGGLVVETAISGKSTQAPIRVAIFADGRLGYEPGRSPNVQTLRLLPLLARGLVAEHDLSPGSSWSAPLPPPGKGNASYRVTAASADTATIAMSASLTVSGPRGFDEHDEATVVYAPDRLCPTAVDLRLTERHQPAPDQYVRTTGHFRARLVSDSFANAR